MKKPSRQVRKQASAPKAIPQGSNCDGENEILKRLREMDPENQKEIIEEFFQAIAFLSGGEPEKN